MLQGTLFPKILRDTRKTFELILIVYKQKCSTIGVKQTNIVPVLGNVNYTLYNVHNIFFPYSFFRIKYLSLKSK